MQDKIDTLCEVRVDELYLTQPHSRLYHLEPIGIGTPLVESLTSYCTRLAEAHSVYPFVLLAREIFPLLNLSYLYHDDRLVYPALTSFWVNSLTLNGTSTTTKNFVRALEQLTRCQHLHFLTMLPFAQVLSVKGLIRRTRAWCSICYEQWRGANQVVYDPLLWSLECVNVCVLHQQRLKQHCPNPDCASTQFQLTARGHLGYCSRCKHWLGSSSQSEEENPFERENEEWKWQQWIGNAVGELLTVAPNFSTPPSLQGVTSVFSIYLRKGVRGSKAKLARQLQVDKRTIDGLVDGQIIPQLATLVRISVRLGTSPLQLIQENIEINDATLGSISLNHPSLKVPKRRQITADIQILQRLQHDLETIVCNPEASPLSMTEVGKRLGYSVSLLVKYFPSLCQKISAQYLDFQRMKGMQRKQKIYDEVQQAVHILHVQGYYPSQNRIEKFCGRRGIFMEQTVTATWRETLRTLELY